MYKDCMDELESDLHLCIRHLSETNSLETRLGRLFVNFLLGHICSMYQRCVRNALTRRANVSDDELGKHAQLLQGRLRINLRRLDEDIFVFDDGGTITDELVTETRLPTKP